MSDEQTVYEELVAATSIEREEGEEKNDFLERLLEGVSALDDDEWKALSQETQEWYNAAAEAYRRDRDLPTLPGMEGDEEGGEEAAKPEPEKKTTRRRAAPKKEVEQEEGGEEAAAAAAEPEPKKTTRKRSAPKKAEGGEEAKPKKKREAKPKVPKESRDPATQKVRRLIANNYGIDLDGLMKMAEDEGIAIKRSSAAGVLLNFERTVEAVQAVGEVKTKGGEVLVVLAQRV